MIILSSVSCSPVDDFNKPHGEDGGGVDSLIQSKVQCPPETLNEGWTVEGESAFQDPLECCDTRVSNWEVAEGYSIQNLDTGCTMSRNLLGRSIFQDIFPVFCKEDKECGDTSKEGHAMECCLDHGYCLARAVNGSSRCDSGEVPGIPNEDFGVVYEDPIGDKVQECRAQGLNPCMSCSSKCSEVTLTSIEGNTLKGRSTVFEKRPKSPLIFPQLNP